MVSATADFSTEAATQITLNAATMHFRSGASCPMVLRLPCGGGLAFGSFHSQELKSFFLSMPGIKALYPSGPQDAFNAMLAAVEDENPVLLFEHKGLYRRGKHPVAWDPDYRSVWRPKRVRAGGFATLVTYGEMVHLANDGAEGSIEAVLTRQIAAMQMLFSQQLDVLRGAAAPDATAAPIAAAVPAVTAAPPAPPAPAKRNHEIKGLFRQPLSSGGGFSAIQRAHADRTAADWSAWTPAPKRLPGGTGPPWPIPVRSSASAPNGRR